MLFSEAVKLRVIEEPPARIVGIVRHGVVEVRLAVAARAHAFLQGRGYVTPQDVKSIAPDVLRHRVIPSFEAEAEELTSDKIVAILLNELPVP